jgi:hypothetical protein
MFIHYHVLHEYDFILFIGIALLKNCFSFSPLLLALSSYFFALHSAIYFIHAAAAAAQAVGSKGENFL